MLLLWNNVSLLEDVMGYMDCSYTFTSTNNAPISEFWEQNIIVLILIYFLDKNNEITVFSMLCYSMTNG